MTNVADIMTRKVLTVSPDVDVRDAARGLTVSGVTGAPVKDEHGNVIGILSKSDLVDAHRVDPAEGTTVRDAMTPVLFAVLATDSVRFAVRRMVETGSHRLVVIDDGKLAGIVTPMDVLKGLLDGRLSAAEFAAGADQSGVR